MSVRVIELINATDMLIPVQMVDGVTTFLPPKGRLENIVVENFYQIKPYVKAVIEMQEVVPPKKGKQKLNE